MSLEYLRNLEFTWYTGKNGKEYDIDEVNQLIWEKESNQPTPIAHEIPKTHTIEFMSNEDLAIEIQIAEIFEDSNLGDLLMEWRLRNGAYD